MVGIRAGLITWSSNLGSTSSGSNTRIDRTKKTKRRRILIDLTRELHALQLRLDRLSALWANVGV